MNERVKAFSEHHNIPHIDMARRFDEAGNSLLESDNKHLTALSHAHMAEELLKHICAAEVLETNEVAHLQKA